METLEKEKIEAYRYLTQTGIICPDFLEQSRRRFETGEIFRIGIPVYPEDGKRAVRGLTARMDAAIGVKSYDTYSLEPLAVVLLTIQIPEIFGWQIGDENKGIPALLLGTAWNQETSWLPSKLKKEEGIRMVKPEDIASRILSSPLGEFSLDSEEEPTSQSFYNWILRKIEWQIQKKSREFSLDNTVVLNEADGPQINFSDIISDPESDTEIIQSIDTRLTLEKLANNASLPPKGKEAFLKSMRGEPLTRTETRARDRALERMRIYCQENQIESQLNS